MPRVRFTQAARADLTSAVDWYKAHTHEIVLQFREAMRDTIGRIENNPKQFAVSAYGTRRALLRRFPYLVIFREQGDVAYIVAVFHTSRDPRVWKARTP